MTKTAGIIYIPKGFKNSADGAKSYLLSKGFNVSAHPFNRLSTVTNLPSFENKLDLMAWYSHGGWDGPVFVWDDTTVIPGQISPDEPMEWVQLMTYFKKQMKPKGLFVAHACHAAGSDSWEKKQDARKGRLKEERIWVRDIAKHMNVYAFGQAGFAGAANISTVKALLEFALSGYTKGYPFRAYAPGGVQMTKPSVWPKP